MDEQRSNGDMERACDDTIQRVPVEAVRTLAAEIAASP
jgi:hypothetical protein